MDMDMDIYTDTDIDMDVDVDMDKDIDLASSDSDSGGTSDPSESESGSDMDENRNGENAAKKKRGRPVGSVRQRSESSTEDFPVREPRKKKMLAIDCLIAIMCCSAMCLGGISQELMVASRENVQSLSHTERKQWLLDYFWSHSNYDEESKKWKFLYVIGTVGVCCSAFHHILGIPSSTFYAVRKMFLNKQRLINNKKERQKMTKSKAAVAWLKCYASNFGEKIPNTCQIHLPPCSTKFHVYETMVNESQVEFLEPISHSHFLRLWREEASYIAIPKHNRFSKCDTCTLIKTKLGETRDPAQRKILIEKREKHLRLQNMERQKYYKHQSKAKTNPSRYLSIIIDGMDQSKTQIPHFVHASKFTSSMWRLRVHLVGVILHGIGVYGLFDLFEYSHSTNLTLSVLMSMFYMLKESLPDVLYLQMDNCARENKNRYVLAFMAYLVERKIFKKVKISFLMVGHTHEDVDQVFSKFSHWLSRHAATTLEKLMTGFEKCFSPRPTSIRTSNVFNITEWLTPHINAIKNHSRPHVFKIIADDSGKARLFWKEWSTDKKWNETAEYLLKSDVEGEPGIIVPSFDEIHDNIDKLENDVKASFKYFAKEEDKEWWNCFFRNYDDTDNNPSWPLEELAAEKRKKNSNTNEEELGDPFTFDLHEETPIPPVVIGKGTATTKQRPVTNDEFVMVDIPKYAGEWPQLCQVVDIAGDNVTVHWFKGSRSTAWTPCKRRIQGTRGKHEAWTETISKQQIWSSSFKLTPSGHIPKKIRDELESYEQY